MRKLLLLFAFTFSFTQIQAQIGYNIEEETRSMSEGVENGIIVSMEMTDVKLAEKLWVDYLKDFGAKPKKVKGTDELLADDADIPGVGAGNTVDVYAIIDDAGGEVEVIVWFNLGGAYLDSGLHPSRYEDAKRFLERYVLSVSKEVVKEELKMEESLMKDLEKELEQLEKQKQKYQDDIARAEETIRAAETGIKENEETQAARQADINSQGKVIEAVKKRLKDLD